MHQPHPHYLRTFDKLIVKRKQIELDRTLSGWNFDGRGPSFIVEAGGGGAVDNQINLQRSVRWRSPMDGEQARGGGTAGAWLTSAPEAGIDPNDWQGRARTAS